jgi:hypothetical protein
VLNASASPPGRSWHLEFVRKQGYLREDLHHPVHQLARQHLDAADQRAAVHVDNLPQNCIWNERDEP